MVEMIARWRWVKKEGREGGRGWENSDPIFKTCKEGEDTRDD